ncbi:MAG: hypothetical protein U9Q30_04820 [Campylobacterota bacterium]|nr:hypothetical protein [Campylobacterota bacterium]
MSGPKKSYYEIRQEEYQRRKAEQRAKREAQINDINMQIGSIENRLSNLLNNGINTNMINNWISQARDTNGDLRDCFRQIRGINNYLSNKENLLKQKQKKLAKEEEEKKVYQEKINTIIDGLDEVKSDYKDVLNDGIKQRVELFKNSIKSNPDNLNTLKQIENLKQTLFKQYEEYQTQKEDTKYVANIFSDALNTNINEDGDGSLSISGSIDGVPISVKLNKNNKNIDFDTPTDGSCKQGLDALQKKLNSANINLGAIKVLKTGQTINATQQNKNSRIKA